MSTDTSAHPARRRVRWAAITSSFVVAALIGGYALTRAQAADEKSDSTVKAQPPAPRVTVAPVEEKLITEFEELTGRVDSTETVELRARVSGHLESVRFQAGQLVNKDDVLFTIDPRWYRAQYDLARAQVDQARAHAEVAEREAKRADDLLAASAISSEEAEARRSRAIEARAAFASAQAGLESAQLDLQYTEVRAPISGRISRALVTPGNLVSGAPGSATVLTTIVSTGDAFVYADIDESTLLKFNRLLRENRIALENGRVPVEMQLSDENGYPRRGYVESSDNRLNAATGSLLLRLVFPNSDNALVPGLFARVRIPVGAPQPALLISERAIGTDQSQKFVLALEQNNTVVYRTVKLGPSFESKRVVRDGLKPGEKIVVNGIQRVRPGMTVQPEVLAADTGSNNTNRIASR